MALNIFHFNKIQMANAWQAINFSRANIYIIDGGDSWFVSELKASYRQRLQLFRIERLWVTYLSFCLVDNISGEVKYLLELRLSDYSQFTVFCEAEIEFEIKDWITKLRVKHENRFILVSYAIWIFSSRIQIGRTL